MNDSEDKLDTVRRISDSDIMRIPRMSIYSDELVANSDELVATSEIFLKAREIAVNRFDIILNKK